MRIAGIYPQSLGNDPKIQHAVSEPYGLEMILAVAKHDGHDVDLFMPAEERDGHVVSLDEEEFVQKISDYEPDVAAFSLYTSQYPMGKRVAAELKKRRPGMVAVAGNRYPTYLATKCNGHLADGEDEKNPFDFFVVKEGEETFRELMVSLENGHAFDPIKGISFRRNGQHVFTGKRERNHDLDSLPDVMRFPIVMNQIYSGISLPPLSENPHYAIVEYSRCCYNSCDFCDNPAFWGREVVFRSPKRVVDEMLALKEQGIDVFYFMDLNFTAFPKKVMELCEEMINRGLNASWYCMSNIATVDRNEYLLVAMKKAGCFKIAWGIESTNDMSLELMNKKTGKKFMTHKQCGGVLQKSLEAGLINQGYYIIGFPWETEETILMDAERLRYTPIHQLTMGVFTPIPLSRSHERMASDGYTFDPNLERHDRNHLIYNHRTLTNGSVKALQRRIYSDFYESREYVERLKTTCEIEPRFERSFGDYFDFLRKSKEWKA